MIRILLMSLILCGCATSYERASSAPSQQPIIKVQCPPIKTYSPDFEKSLSAAVADLSANNPIITAMADYGALRSAIRACN